MKTIVLDFSRIDSQSETSGVFRYARDLMVELKRSNPSDLSFVVLGSLPSPHAQIAPIFGEAWRYHPVALHQDRAAWLLNNLRVPSGLGKVDVFHGLSSYVPLFSGSRTVATVHDLMHEMFPEYEFIAKGKTYRFQKFLLRRRADALIAISNSTRNDLLERWHVPAPLVHTIPLGTVFRARPATRRESGPTLLLSPYNLEPRKNLGMLIEALSLADGALGDYRLELFGRAAVNDEREGKFKQLVTSKQLDAKVKYLGILSDEALAEKMASADLFLFPSLYEGFGLPVLEAMAVGANVLAAKRGAMVEVVGNAGYLVDDMTAAGWSRAIQSALTAESAGVSLREKAVGVARERTAAAMAKQTLELYRELLAR